MPKIRQPNRKVIINKLDSLQEQLNMFEKKYESLEIRHKRFVSQNTPARTERRFKMSFATEKDREKAAVRIQKHWRGGRLESF